MLGMGSDSDISLLFSCVFSRNPTPTLSSLNMYKCTTTSMDLRHPLFTYNIELTCFLFSTLDDLRFCWLLFWQPKSLAMRVSLNSVFNTQLITICNWLLNRLKDHRSSPLLTVFLWRLPRNTRPLFLFVFKYLTNLSQPTNLPDVRKGNPHTVELIKGKPLWVTKGFHFCGLAAD